MTADAGRSCFRHSTIGYWHDTVRKCIVELVAGVGEGVHDGTTFNP